jgi:hypothetical protein
MPAWVAFVVGAGGMVAALLTESVSLRRVRRQARTGPPSATVPMGVTSPTIPTG